MNLRQGSMIVQEFTLKVLLDLISRVMTHAQRLRKISLGNNLRTTRRLGHTTMITFSKNRVMEIACSFSRGLQHQHVHQLVLHPQVLTRSER